eukprot:TRINITY_DN3321_c4_g3_i11.p2 TRINITY_DN3321_c4_g3~~TRINITY_DN3321_c4_g3_i11.p2  ORF type:complete len:58 (-),score=7.31 TRINITY_DN3321_c4_g3_i11:90-263(-)
MNFLKCSLLTYFIHLYPSSYNSYNFMLLLEFFNFDTLILKSKEKTLNTFILSFVHLG